jgi:hypothetical protein
MASAEFRICDQSLLELVNVMTRVRAGSPLMSPRDAAHRTDLYTAQFPSVLSDEHQLAL